jgi:hypothetical protein
MATLGHVFFQVGLVGSKDQLAGIPDWNEKITERNDHDDRRLGNGIR